MVLLVETLCMELNKENDITETVVYNKLILSGGGIKGSMYIGMLKYLEENDIILEYINEITGTSIGAFIGMLLILGYTSRELEEIFLSLNFEDLKDVSLVNLETNYGFASGIKLSNLIKKLISDKKFDSDINLRALHAKSGVSLVVCGYNVNKKTSVFFDVYSTPDIPVHLAILISMSIPILFCAVKHKGDLYTDGGIVCNLPVKYYIQKYKNKKDLDKVMKKTLSVVFEEINYHKSDVISTFDDYLYSIIKSSFNHLETKDKQYIKTRNYALLVIETNLTSTANFTLTETQKKELLDAGYNATKKFFNCTF